MACTKSQKILELLLLMGSFPLGKVVSLVELFSLSCHNQIFCLLPPALALDVGLVGFHLR